MSVNIKEAYITNPQRLQAGTFKPGELQYYTIHSTANLLSTAQNERDNLQNNNGEVSFHSVVDDKECIRCVPFTHKCWHTGDYQGNNTSVGLEICESGNRLETLKNAIQVVAFDLYNMGWDVERLKQHYDWSGKNCPRILRQGSKDWNFFVNNVKIELEKIKKGVEPVIPEWANETIEWALSNGILADDPKNLSQSEIKALCYCHRTYKLIKGE